MNEPLTPEQVDKLKVLRKSATRTQVKLTMRYIFMIVVIGVLTIIINAMFVKNDNFIILSNFIGALLSAINMKQSMDFEKLKIQKEVIQILGTNG